MKYPAVMGVGGWNNPRVPPWEPGKPVLMKINYDDGHFTEEKSSISRILPNRTRS